MILKREGKTEKEHRKTSMQKEATLDFRGIGEVCGTRIREGMRRKGSEWWFEGIKSS